MVAVVVVVKKETDDVWDKPELRMEDRIERCFMS